MSGKQPIRCKQGQSQNSDLMFHIQLLSWENENCYRYYRQLLVGGQLSGSGGLNVSVPPGRISFPSEFGPARSGSAGSGNLWLRLNQFRAASESWGKQPQELAWGGAEGSLTGKMTIHKEKQCQFTLLMISKYCPGMQKALTSLEKLRAGEIRDPCPHTCTEKELVIFSESFLWETKANFWRASNGRKQPYDLLALRLWEEFFGLFPLQFCNLCYSHWEIV